MLLLQQVGNLKLEGVSNDPHVEKWCAPQIAGYERLERPRKAGVCGRMEGVDDDWNGTFGIFENIPDSFGPERDMCAYVLVTPLSIGNSTCGVELGVREGYQPGVDHREKVLYGLCKLSRLWGILRAALTVLRSGDVGVGDPGTGDRGLVGGDIVARMKGGVALTSWME